MKKNELLKTLTRVMHEQPTAHKQRQLAIEDSFRSILKRLDPELCWVLGLALVAAKVRHQVDVGRGLLFAAALSGHDAALNSLAISLEQKGTPRWQKKLAILLEELGAKRGDPIAMSNMFVTYKKSDPDRAWSWLVKAAQIHPHCRDELNRLVKENKVTKKQLMRYRKIKPW